MVYNEFEIGKRLKQLRTESGLSLNKVAAYCGVEQYQTVSKWETGNNVPALKHLLKLCNLYDCDIDYLLGKIPCKRHKSVDICEKTGLSENAICKLEYLFVGSPETVKVLNLLIEFNDSDILKLIREYLDFEYPHDITAGNFVFSGQVLDNHFLMEMNAELKALKEKCRKENN